MILRDAQWVRIEKLMQVRPVIGAVGEPITASLSRQSCGLPDQEVRSAISLQSLAPGTAPMFDFPAAPPRMTGTTSLRFCAKTSTSRKSSSTAPSCVRTSTLPGQPKKKGASSGTFSRGTDHRDPRLCRMTGSARKIYPDRWPGPRCDASPGVARSNRTCCSPGR